MQRKFTDVPLRLGVCLHKELHSCLNDHICHIRKESAEDEPHRREEIHREDYRVRLFPTLVNSRYVVKFLLQSGSLKIQMKNLFFSRLRPWPQTHISRGELVSSLLHRSPDPAGCSRVTATVTEYSLEPRQSLCASSPAPVGSLISPTVFIIYLFNLATQLFIIYPFQDGGGSQRFHMAL